MENTKDDAKKTTTSDSTTEYSGASFSSGATCRSTKSAFSVKSRKCSRESLFSVPKFTREHFSQDHARCGIKTEEAVAKTNRSSGGSLSNSINDFRGEFDQLTCKMKIFGESLNLCKCISNDFQVKLQDMERRLELLEKRQRRTGSNYLEIIQKNKQLSNRTHQDLKKLQMCGTEEEMREVAARICRNYLHGTWKTIEPSQLEFRRISGGLSNFLYYVALKDEPAKPQGEHSPRAGERSPDHSPDHLPERVAALRKMTRCTSLSITEEPRKVLLRIYGQVHGERAMDAIVTESVIFTLLSERRLGPKLHGVFSGGRIEEYIPARPLLTKELAEPALSMKIAEKMAAIHSMDIPLSKEPNWLWKTMGKWLKTVTSERLSTSYIPKNEQEENIIKRLKNIDFEKEIEWLKKFISSIECPVVFCHNDLQEGNILMLEDHVQNSPDDDINYVHSYNYKVKANATTDSIQLDDANTTDSISSHLSDSGEPKLVLIDFEYCAYNYRGFDLANHFQEWSYDYTNPEHPFYFELPENAPSLEQKEIFIREYLKHYQANLMDEGEALPPTIDEINELLHEVEAFALASHLFWCLWSVVNASKSQIPFGYWEYAISRLDTYLRLKQEVIKKDKFGLPLKRKICEVDI